MGWLRQLFSGSISGVASAVTDVAEVFRPNAEASAQRAAQHAQGAQQQYSAEFQGLERKNWFNALIDGLNRLPRPMLAFGTIGLFVYAMADPLGFGERMQGLALVPDQLWWLLGAIVSFYFGAREMSKFRDVKFAAPSTVQNVVQNIRAIRELRSDSPNVASDDVDVESGAGNNPAVDDWKANG